MKKCIENMNDQEVRAYAYRQRDRLKRLVTLLLEIRGQTEQPWFTDALSDSFLDSDLDGFFPAVLDTAPILDKAWIYFARSGELIKIGITTDMKGRMATLATSSPVPIVLIGTIETTVPKALADERVVHSTFGTRRHHGEWFEITEDEARNYVENRDGIVEH